VFTKIFEAALVTVVNIPEKGELWPTHEKVNVPTSGDVQQVPLSNLEILRMESCFGACSKSWEDGLKQLV
jgi:hypothetical protein